jgi:hypothetical protein
MKKRIITMAVAFLLAMLVATPVFAGGGEKTDVQITTPTVTGEPVNGTTVTVSGSISVIAEAWNNSILPYASALGSASYEIIDPGSNTVASGSQSSSDFDWGLFHANANGDMTYDWSTPVYLGSLGMYTVNQQGSAEASYGNKLLWWLIQRGYSCSSGEDTFQFLCQEFDPLVHDGFYVYSQTDGFYVACQSGGNYMLHMWDGIMSRTLKDSVDQTGKGVETIRIVIPVGTVVNKDGCLCENFRVDYIGGQLSFSPSWITFSQPVTIYLLQDDGTWSTLATFTSIENGIPK